MIMYGSMKVYRDVMHVKGPWFWWVFSKRHTFYTCHCRIFLRLLSECHLHERDHGRETCCLCDIVIQDKSSHMLFQCERVREERTTEWQKVVDVLPPAMTVSLDRMNVIEKTVFLADGFHGTYTQEWYELYVSVLKFVRVIYDACMNVLDSV